MSARRRARRAFRSPMPTPVSTTRPAPSSAGDGPRALVLCARIGSVQHVPPGTQTADCAECNLSQKTRLGKALDSHEGRIWGKWRLVRGTNRTANKTALWRLQDPAQPVAEDGPDLGDDEAGGPSPDEDFVSS